MSLRSGMYTGVSGILTYGDSMGVIGDNIANVNTVGFKSNRTVFSDILANSLANGDTVMQMGRGVFTHNIDTSWAQGSFENTANATDVAIQGEGLFRVYDEDNDGYFYTRAGQFTLDRNGKLVNPNGFVVQGRAITAGLAGSSTISGQMSNIDMDGVQSMPRATQNFRVGMNLNAAASAGTTFNTSFDVHNNLGERVSLTFAFTKSASLNWDYAISASSGTITSGGTGSLVFNNSGNLLSSASGGITPPNLQLGTFTTTGAAGLDMAWNTLQANGTSYADMTSYASPSTTTFIEQDGYSNGILKGLAVGTDGIITGLFSNGQTDPLYQLVLTKFSSPWGLERMGGSMYAETRDSGQPIFGSAGIGGLGSVLGSALELSNVDLASEFVKMIQHQRAYQASSRVITTTDDMLQEAVNLKR